MTITKNLFFLRTLLGLSVTLAVAQISSVAQNNRTSVDAFAEVKTLAGEWHTPEGEGKEVITDIFRPLVGGAFLYEEWKGGEQLTSTVFYMVGNELRADHFCDYGNQLHYTVKPTSEGNTLLFELRDATNLDTHPRHFHSATWRFVDATHLTQDWEIRGGGKESKMVRLEFTRQK